MTVRFENTPRLWADLVFHVLAHVEATRRLPASSFDPVYVAFAGRHLGPARQRSLGQDAAVLGRAASTHDVLARVQALAWVFHTLEEAAAVADRALGSLPSDDTPSCRSLSVAQSAGPVSEVLWCATLLEMAAFAGLPSSHEDRAALQAGLAEVTRAAPHLRRCRVSLVRSLRLRGRVSDHDIWVGIPCAELDLGVAHVAWQAAHEATVAEVSQKMYEWGLNPHHDRVEPAAVVLMAERSQRAGLGGEHRRWLAHLARAPSTDREALSVQMRSLVEHCFAAAT